MSLTFKTITTGNYQADHDLGTFDIHHGVPTQHDWSTHFTPKGGTKQMHETLLRRKRDCIALANEWVEELTGATPAPTEPTPEPVPEPEVVEPQPEPEPIVLDFTKPEAGLFVATTEDGQYIVQRHTPDKWVLSFAEFDGEPVEVKSFRSGKAAQAHAQERVDAKAGR